MKKQGEAIVNPADLVRRASRTVLHASERGRRGLFVTLTSENAAAVEVLLKQKPIFYNNIEGAPQEILLDKEISSFLPKEFFMDPSGWIEQQKNIERGQLETQIPKGETIQELWQLPYDVSRVKILALTRDDGTTFPIVSKRLDRGSIEEVELARKAWEAGIPTPKVVGEIIARGNAYVWFEYVPALSLLAACEKFGIETLIYPPKTLSNQSDFLNELHSTRYSRYLTEKQVEELLTLWKSYKSVFVRYEVLVLLETSIPRVNSAQDASSHKNDLLRQVGEGGRIDPDMAAAVLPVLLKELGYASLDDYYSALQLSSASDFSLQAKLLSVFDDMLTKMIPDLREYNTRYQKTLYQMLLGFDYWDEKERLKNLCEEKGIQHKDFENRNILLMWDFVKDRSLLDEAGKGRTLLIDWEPVVDKKAENESL